MRSKQKPTQDQIPDFEETRNCYYCRHFKEQEEFRKGRYHYKFFCKEHKTLLNKIGWCPSFERLK